MRIAFIINSNSPKARKAIDAIRSQLRHEHEAHFTTAIGSACQIASSCLKKDFTHIAVLGGDGTVNEVFNAMMNSRKAADELPILCIYPCGTGNDFARNLDYKKNISNFFSRLDQGSIQYSDGGLACYTNLQGEIEQRFFINAMDVGLGGHIAQRVNQYRRDKLAFLAYQRSILRTLPFYKKRNIRVTTSTIIHSGPAMCVVVANGKWFGKGLGIAPKAHILDGQLECVILARVSIWDYIMNLGSLLRCKTIIHPEVTYHKLQEISIDGETNPIEVDGEFVGTSPAQIRVVSRAVRLLIG